MDVSKWFARETWDLDVNEWLIIVACAAATGLVLTTAWSTPAATIFIALAVPAQMMANARPLRAYQPGLFDAILILFVNYAMMSALWAPDLVWSGRALWPVMGVLLLPPLVFATARDMPADWLEHFCRTALVAYCVLLIYSLFEETTGHALKRFLFWPFQAAKFDGGVFSVNWNHVSRVVPYRTNWNMTALCFLLWPVLIILKSQVTLNEFRIGRLIIIVLVAATILQSHHQAAIVALVVGCLTYGVARLSLRTATVGLVGMWIATFALAVPIAHGIFAAGVQEDRRLPASFRQRAVFWKYTANRIAERPLFGHGIGATHPLNEARKPTAVKAPGTSFVFETGTHPHNIYLQALYELGMLGAGMLLLLGLVALRMLCTLANRKATPYLLAAFAAWAAQSALSFGLFEPWYVFVNLFAVCLAIMAYRHAATARKFAD